MGTTSAIVSILGTAASIAMAPKAPRQPAPRLMPDQRSLLQSQQLAEAKAAALRRGRASTMLTSNADTGDKLGP